MAATVKSYFLAPTWDYQKDGPLALGNIISDPRDPVFSQLSSFDSIQPQVQPKIYNNPPEQWSHTASNTNSYDVNIFAQFLEGLGIGLGAGVSTSSERHEERSYTMDSIQTSYFVPDPSYTLARLRDPQVSLFLGSRGLFQSKKLYIITGVKIARGLVVRTVTGKKRTAGANAEVSLTPIGVPISVGVGGQIGRGRQNETTAGKDPTGVEVVFAYQLRRITIKGKAGQERVEGKPYSKGAFMFEGHGGGDGAKRDVSDVQNEDDFEIDDYDVDPGDVEDMDMSG